MNSRLEIFTIQINIIVIESMLYFNTFQRIQWQAISFSSVILPVIF